MNFFQRVKTGRLFHKKKEPETVIKFTFMEKDYVVEAFDLTFTQEINQKGLPGGLPRGGIMSITISETPDYYINEWMLREELLRDGLIRFFPNRDKIDEGSQLDIFFKDAYCVRYSKVINTLGAGLLTTLMVSPRYVKIGQEEFENNWKRQEPLSHYIRSK